MSPRTELSSITSVLDELSARLDGVLADLDAGERDRLAPDLYEVERTIRAAQRRLTKLIDTVR
jgi:hypothetical protein